MPVVKCPDCGKSLKVGDDLAGKRVRCPGCKNPFVVPESAPVLEAVDEEEEQEEQEERVTAKPRPRRDAVRTPPARRPRDDEEDEEEDEDEDDDRPRRPRSRRLKRDVSVSSAPLVFGILSCLLSCAPLIGFILGSVAINKANAELDNLPRGKSGRAARKQLQFAKTLGVIGMCLSGVMLVLGIVLRVMFR